MGASYINLQFSAINYCKLFSTALKYTTAIKAWRLPQHRRAHGKNERLQAASLGAS
jgi:hypothetical protein